jgi:heme exporter protein D
MNWNSLGEFFNMGGYGLYVWGSYGAWALATAIELAAAKRRRTKALANLAEKSIND